MRKSVSILLTVAVLISVLSVGIVLPTAAESEIVVTGGVMTAVTKANQLPKATNLLAGVAPTWGSTGKAIGTGLLEGDLAALSDGVVQGFNAIATEEDRANTAARIVCSNGTWTQAQNTWKQKVFLTYDLGAEKTMNTVVIAHSIIGQLADNPTTPFKYKGGVIVTNDLTGFDSENAANSYDWADLSFADTQENYAVLSAGHVQTAPIVKFTLDQEQTGRYVVINLEVAGGENFYPGTKLNSVYLSEVGVYNEVAPVVTGATMTEVTSKRGLPRGTNLLKGLKALWGWNGGEIETDTTAGGNKYLLEGSTTYMTDGKVQGLDVIATEETRSASAARVVAGQHSADDTPIDQWKTKLYLTYDLGESKALDTVLLSHSVVGALADVVGTAYAYKLTVRVSDDRKDTENDEKICATLSSAQGEYVITAPVVVLTLNEAVTGRYVLFEIEVPGKGNGDPLLFTYTEGDKTYKRNWAYFSEIGVYNTAVNVTGGTATEVNGSHLLPKQNNLLAGLTPFWGNAGGGMSKVSITAGEKACLEGTPKALTDGKVQGLTTWTEADGVAQSALCVAANNGAHNVDTYDRWRSQVWISFDMGARKAIDKVLVAHSVISDLTTDGYTPNGKRATTIEVRVTDEVADLATADPVLTFTPADAANMADVFVAQLDDVAVGRYVGFFFSVPGSNTDYFLTADGKTANYIYLSELGVYAAPLNSAGAQVRDPEAATHHALRFVFEAAVTGAKYVEDSYVGDLSAATVLVDGVKRKVKSMGAVVSIAEPEGALTLDSVDGAGTHNVPAANLYAVEAQTVTYTAVVVGIPNSEEDTPLYAVPYIVYETAQGDVTLYGEMLTRTVAELLESTESI